MSSTLSLNPVHSDLITELLKLTKYQQNQRLKSINHCFKNSLRIRDDEVYSGDEVRSMITALQDTVQSEVETELRDASHTSVLLVQQLLTTAEQWHLTLTANIAELEDREKLNMIKEYEDGVEKAPGRMSITVTQSKQVIPAEDMLVASVLKGEIADLKAENDLLNDKVKGLEMEVAENKAKIHQEVVLVDTPSLKAQLSQAQAQIEILTQRLSQQESRLLPKDAELEAVQAAVRNMTEELAASRELAEEETEKLRKDLESREDKLRQVQSNLLLKEKELEQKFQATTAYGNMKKMLVQKNAIIKALRKELAEAGHSVGDGADATQNIVNDDDD